MKRNLIVLSLFVLSTCFTSVFSQKQERNFLSSLALSIGGSTTGYRLDLAAPINDRFNLIGGFSFFKFKGDAELDISSATAYEKYLKYQPEIAVDADLAMMHGHLLLDFTPSRQGIFHITAGLFFGNMEISSGGLLVNPQTKKSIVQDLKKAGYNMKDLPEFTFEDNYTMKPNQDGRLDAMITMGNKVKPYLGIGVGRSVPRKRVGVKFDLGMLYQGDPNISSPNLISGDFNNYIKDSKDLKDYEKYFSWWPVLNLQLTVKLF